MKVGATRASLACMGEDKRTSDRHRVRFKLVYDDGQSFNAGLVHDLSETGVFLETADPLQVGQSAVLSSLDVDADRAFELDARVTRVVAVDDSSADNLPGMGLVFENMSSEQAAQVVHLIERMEAEEAQFEGERDPFFGKSLPRDGLRRSPSGVWRSTEPTDDEA